MENSLVCGGASCDLLSRCSRFLFFSIRFSAEFKRDLFSRPAFFFLSPFGREMADALPVEQALCRKGLKVAFCFRLCRAFLLPLPPFCSLAFFFKLHQLSLSLLGSVATLVPIGHVLGFFRFLYCALSCTEVPGGFSPPSEWELATFFPPVQPRAFETEPMNSFCFIARQCVPFLASLL